MWVLGPALPVCPLPAGSFAVEDEGPVIPDPLPDEQPLIRSATTIRITADNDIGYRPSLMDGSSRLRARCKSAFCSTVVVPAYPRDMVKSCGSGDQVTYPSGDV